MQRIPISAAIISGCVTTVTLGQSVQTVPPELDSTPGNTCSIAPIANGWTGTYQVMFGSDLLMDIPAGSLITGMQLRLDSVYSRPWPTASSTQQRYDIKLATSSLTPVTMSRNYGLNMVNPVQVRSGPFSLAAGAYQWLNSGAGVAQPWGPLISFTQSYVYKGGPLVVEMRVTSMTPGFYAGYADFRTWGGTQRWMYTANNPDATMSSFPPSAGGMIMRLVFTANATCLGDLNNDGSVEDSDFQLFVTSYEILDCADETMPSACRADFNADQLVDDLDFQIFIGAYDNMFCSSS